MEESRIEHEESENSIYSIWTLKDNMLERE